MNKTLIGAAAIAAVCLASQLQEPAEGEPDGKEQTTGGSAESPDVQNARMFRALTRSPFSKILQKGIINEQERQRLHAIEGMVAYAEAAYDLVASQPPGEPASGDPFVSLRRLAEKAQQKFEADKRKPAGSVSVFELQQAALKAEVLRRAAQARALPGKPQIDRIEWKVDMLSLELWLLIDRLSSQEGLRAAASR